MRVLRLFAWSLHWRRLTLEGTICEVLVPLVLLAFTSSACTPSFQSQKLDTKASTLESSGSYATAIAHWDVVPFDDFTGLKEIGVLAVHHMGIESVKFWVSQSGTFTTDPQFVVTTKAANPSTTDRRNWGPMPTIARPDVEDYFITLNAGDYTSGVPLKIKAVAVPRSGNSKTVLSPSLNGADTITVTPYSSAPLRTLYYAYQNAPSGNTTCTAAAPCSTLLKVFQRMLVVGGSAAALGTSEIRLGPSSQNQPWTLEGAGAPNHQGQTRWLIIKADPAVNPATVFINPFPNGYQGSWSVELTKFERVTITGPMYTSYQNASNKRYLWFDQVGIVGEGLITIQQGNSWSVSGGADPTMITASYMTDSYIDYLASGPRNQEYALNIFAVNTGDGHSSGSATVVNYTLKTAFGSNYYFPTLGQVGPDYHGDLYQFYSRQADVILYGFRIQPGGILSLRGIVGKSDNGFHHDIAILNTDVDLTVNGSAQWVFSFCASSSTSGIGHTIDHLVVEDSRMVGSGDFCGEAPGGPSIFDPARISHVLLRNSSFVNGSALNLPLQWNTPGIRVYPCPLGSLYCDNPF